MAGPTIARAEVEVDLDGSQMPRQARAIAAAAGAALGKELVPYGKDAAEDFGDQFGETVRERMRRVGYTSSAAFTQSFRVDAQGIAERTAYDLNSEFFNRMSVIGGLSGEQFARSFVIDSEGIAQSFGRELVPVMRRTGSQAMTVWGEGAQTRSKEVATRLTQAIGAAVGAALGKELVPYGKEAAEDFGDQFGETVREQMRRVGYTSSAAFAQSFRVDAQGMAERTAYDLNDEFLNRMSVIGGLSGEQFSRSFVIDGEGIAQSFGRELVPVMKRTGSQAMTVWGQGAQTRSKEVATRLTQAIVVHLDKDGVFRSSGGAAGDDFVDGFARRASGRMRRFAGNARAALVKLGGDWGGGLGGKVFGAEFGKGALSGMDRTVALVLRLIASIGPQMAALGSALSAQFVALLSSALVGLSGALVALAPAAVVALGGVLMAVKGINDLREAVPGAVDGIDKLGDAFGGQTTAFVGAFADSLDRLTESLAAVVGASTFGTALGGAFAQIADAFDAVVNGPSFAAFMVAMQTTIPATVANLGRGFASLTAALLDMAAAAAPLGEQLSSSFAQWADSFSASMAQMRAEGSLEDYFTGAGESMGALSGLLGPLTSALGNVFAIGADNGERMLGILGELAARFDAFSSSDAGRQAIEAWFAAGEEVFPHLLEVVGALGTTLADMVTPETVQQVNDLLGTLTDLLPIVGDILSVIGEANLVNLVGQALLGIGKAIEPLLPALSGIATAIGGIDPSVIQAIAVGFGAWIALAKIITVIGPVIAGVSRLIGLFRILATSTGVVRAAFLALSIVLRLNPLGLIITAITAVIAALAYFFTQTELGKDLVAGAWEGIQTAVAAVSDWFTNTLVPGLQSAWDSIVAGVQGIGAWFAAAWQAILDAPANVMAWFTGTLVPFFQALPGMLLDGFFALVEFFFALPGRIIGGLLTLVAMLIDWGTQAAVALIQWAADAIPKLIAFFADLPGNVMKWWDDLKIRLGTFLINLWDDIQKSVTEGVIAVGMFFADLPGNVMKWWNDLQVQLGTFLINLWSDVKRSVSDGITAVVEFFSKLGDRVKGALVSFGSRLLEAITSGMNEGDRAASDGVVRVLATVGQMPGKIGTALGNLGSTLYSAGRDLIQGLMNGIDDKVRSLINRVTGIAKDVTATVMGVFGERSPSKVFAEIGKNLMVGLVNGVDANARHAIGAVGSVADQMVSAMNVGAVPTLNARSGVGAGNTLGVGGRVVNVNSGAITVTAPTGDPYQVANAVVDRLVARAR